MRAPWGPWSVRTVAALMGLAMIMAPSLAHAGGTRRAPPRPVAPSSEGSAQIDGQVVGLDGLAIAGVTVLATPSARAGTYPDARRHPRVESDRDGRFHFALPPGDYVFVALHRELAGLTPVLSVARALEVVLVLSKPAGAA